MRLKVPFRTDAIGITEAVPKDFPSSHFPGPPICPENPTKFATVPNPNSKDPNVDRVTQIRGTRNGVGGEREEKETEGKEREESSRGEAQISSRDPAT
jgi:hypothetical protein